MLTFIKDLTDKLLDFIKDDPVRPEISKDFRVSDGRMVAALVEEESPAAMVCVSFHDFVPQDVNDLNTTAQVPTTAVFYTIWSYKAGKGRELLIQAVRQIQKDHPTITRFVTLSPKTETARRFHLRNGAIVFRENLDSTNYEYSKPQDIPESI
jgi:Malonyl-CoA decarboxylase C-terminal domain